MNNQKMDFYQNLRASIREWLQGPEGKSNKWADYLMIAPDFIHLICKLAVDPDVAVADKAKLGVVIVYFISPIDLIPELFVGPVGYLDDIALTAYALNGILAHTDPSIIQKHWAGQGEILQLIQQILAVADEMVGDSRWAQMKTWFNRQ